MKILNAGCPRADGFYMPAEYAPHKGTIIIWPKRPGSWIYGARRAREAFAEVICAIAESEQAYVLAEADVIDNARSVVEGFVREIISKIQTMRKDAGFEVMDHIAVTYEADEKLSNVFEKFGDEIKTEVLAVSIKSGELKGYEKDWKINGEAVKLAVEKQ